MESKEKIEDGFLNLLHVEYMKNENMERGNPYWNQIKRDFSDVYTNEIPCYIHLSKAGVSLTDGNQHNIRILLGYLVSNSVISFSGGVSVGTALKMMDRKEVDLNFILNGNLDRVIQELRNWSGLMRSHTVKLNAFNFIRDMYNWKAQESSSNKNWVRKMWIKDYIKAV